MGSAEAVVGKGVDHLALRHCSTRALRHHPFKFSAQEFKPPNLGVHVF
jgi:hypothetical protein